MAENDAIYLRRCLDQGICAVCQQPLTTKVGSGQFKDGVFCSLDCHARWHEALLRRQHQNRPQNGSPDE